MKESNRQDQLTATIAKAYVREMLDLNPIWQTTDESIATMPTLFPILCDIPGRALVYSAGSLPHSISTIPCP